MTEQKKHDGLNLMRAPGSEGPSEGDHFLEKLLLDGLINQQALDALPEKARAQLTHHAHPAHLLNRLVECELLTAYQADRIRSDKVQGLMLDKYRVLDRLGVGNDGVVFRGEHRETGQKVAIKVLIPPRDLDPKPMLRFFAERQMVGQLCHPGIVRALDVGEVTSDDPEEPVLYYYVMEHVPGLDLEQYVQKNGPMLPSLACEAIHQVADALTEAHKHHLVHRDINPSNILLTPEGRAMLLDFGLMRQFQSRQTEMGSLVGMLEWIAPEQAKDPRAVDIRADIYSLGCTLFWCLTGKSPYGGKDNPRAGLAQLQTLLPPPSVQSVQCRISAELDAVVARMMAPLPDNRYPNPQAVMAALAPFVSDKFVRATPLTLPTDGLGDALTRQGAPGQVLIVEDDPLSTVPNEAEMAGRPKAPVPAKSLPTPFNWLFRRKKPTPLG